MKELILSKFLYHKCKIDHVAQVKTHTLQMGLMKPPWALQSSFYIGFKLPRTFAKTLLYRSFVKELCEAPRAFAKPPLDSGFTKSLGPLQNPFSIGALQSPIPMWGFAKHRNICSKKRMKCAHVCPKPFLYRGFTKPLWALQNHFLYRGFAKAVEALPNPVLYRSFRKPLGTLQTPSLLRVCEAPQYL